MSIVRLFEGNPNPKVATFEIDKDLLGHFSKLIVTKTGALLQHCPIAEPLFKGDVTRIDLAARDGKTYITLSRKLMAWDTAEKEAVQRRINEFLSKSTPAVYADAISTAIQTQKPFTAANPVTKLVQATFNQIVNPILANDGGAMELLNIDIKPSGDIAAEVALIGSCNGCSSAETQTLVGATKTIRQALQSAKAQHKGNPDIQKLLFTGITVREIPEIALTR
ncbi:MAG TPA: NifU family protein [Alphaproteobacteria bacterium]|nr:NifU family protein [Alphaproteobacteria bacterium]